MVIYKIKQEFIFEFEGNTQRLEPGLHQATDEQAKTIDKEYGKFVEKIRIEKE